MIGYTALNDQQNDVVIQFDFYLFWSTPNPSVCFFMQNYPAPRDPQAVCSGLFHIGCLPENVSNTVSGNNPDGNFQEISSV
jgi:hypothetical protein